MHRIKDLPRGGAAASGREMWFAIESEAGEVSEYRLPLEHLDAFIAGLRTFEAEAAAVRLRAQAGGIGPPPTPAYLPVDRFRITLSPDGDLQLELGATGSGQLRAAVPRPSIKAFLVALVRGVSVRSDASEGAGPPVTSSRAAGR